MERHSGRVVRALIVGDDGPMEFLKSPSVHPAENGHPAVFRPGEREGSEQVRYLTSHHPARLLVMGQNLPFSHMYCLPQNQFSSHSLHSGKLLGIGKPLHD